MPSPVTSADFDLQNFSGDVCERIRKLLEINDTLRDFFDWFLDADGNLTEEFKAQVLRPKALFTHEEADGTDGGAFTSGAWRTRTINTQKYNSISGASLAANQITLPAGTYILRAYAIGFQCDFHKLAVYNATDAAFIAYGTSERTQFAITSKSFVECRFTLTAAKAIEIQHRCNLTSANGFGVAANLGGGETYLVCQIEKE